MYTSPDIQNEILQIMALSALKEISEDIRDARCYTIMADETSDISNTTDY